MTDRFRNPTAEDKYPAPPDGAAAAVDVDVRIDDEVFVALDLSGRTGRMARRLPTLDDYDRARGWAGDPFGAADQPTDLNTYYHPSTECNRRHGKRRYRA